MPAPVISAKLALAMRTSAGMAVPVKINGVNRVRTFRAAEQAIRCMDLFRLTGVGEHSVADALHEYDRLEKANAKAAGSPLRTADGVGTAGD